MEIHMAEFRCKRSGNFVSFTSPDDIEAMRKHEGYEETKEEVVQPVAVEMLVPVKRKPGRPFKNKVA